MLGKQEPNEGARKPRNFQVEPTRRHSYTFAQAPYNNFLNNSSNNFGELARSSTSTGIPAPYLQRPERIANTRAPTATTAPGASLGETPYSMRVQTLYYHLLL